MVCLNKLYYWFSVCSWCDKACCNFSLKLFLFNHSTYKLFVSFHIKRFSWFFYLAYDYAQANLDSRLMHWICACVVKINIRCVLICYFFDLFVVVARSTSRLNFYNLYLMLCSNAWVIVHLRLFTKSYIEVTVRVINMGNMSWATDFLHNFKHFICVSFFVLFHFIF